MRNDNDGWMAILGAALLAGIALVLALGGCSEAEAELPHMAPGQPLDAIRYNAPEWSKGESAWLVRDRQTGDEWWLVKMGSSGDGEWAVLPRSEWEVGK